MPHKPAPQRDAGPDRLDQPERPRTLEESIKRAQRAGSGKAEDELVAAVLQGVTDKHRGYREQSEQAQGIHRVSFGRTIAELKYRTFHAPGRARPDEL